MKKYDSDLSLIKKILTLLSYRYQMDSFSPAISRKKLYKLFKKNNPTLFCINDCEQATDKDRENSKKVLEKIFPVKSSFEK